MLCTKTVSNFLINPETESPRIVVIGTAVGGLDILNNLIEQLPEKLPAAVFFTCPDCGGNLWEMSYGFVFRCWCQLDHAFSADSLLKDMNEAMEETFWMALRMMEERKNLLTTLLEREEQKSKTSWTTGQRERVEDIKVHMNCIREVLLGTQYPENNRR